MTFTTMWLTMIAALALALAPGGPGGTGGHGGSAGPGKGPGLNADVGTGVGAAGCAGGAGADARCWPVVGRGPRGRPTVLRGFDPPPAPWAAGHRGADLRAGPGATVRAAAPGEVAFAGPVGGSPVVVVRLADGLRITYEPVRATLPVGTRVAAGLPVGVLTGGLAHCPAGCLHWGLLRGADYLDPLTLLPPSLLRSAPSRLLPVCGVPSG